VASSGLFSSRELDQSSGQKRDRDFVMAGERVALTSGLSVGAFDYIDARTVVLDEIQILCGLVSDLFSNIW
jgi:hypothetical protein